MALLEKKQVHCIGIGGIGVSGLAKILMSRGMRVSGSDLGESAITEELISFGVPVSYGHAAGNLPEDTEAIIFSSAVPVDNPERQEALRRGIPEFSYSEALGELSRGYRTIAVSGTHGKSTTTAMLGSMLIEAGLDPLILVGTKTTNFSHGNAHLGKGEWFVVEACEHEAQMMQLQPEFIIINNLEPDHLDYYGTFEHLQETFKKYVAKVAPDHCIINFDEPAVRALFADPNETRSFGWKSGRLHGVSRTTASGQQDCVITDGTQEFTFTLRIPGVFNVMNAMAAFSAATAIGIDVAHALRAASQYPGSWRRFQRVGTFNGAEVISDYGHHPTAVRETVKATREFFPDKRLVLVYQPHHHHRTEALYDQFVDALQDPDALILNEIYGVAGREHAGEEHVSSKQLFQNVQEKRGEEKSHWYSQSLEETTKLIQQHALPDDVILVMGAGDIYKIAHQMCEK